MDARVSAHGDAASAPVALPAATQPLTHREKRIVVMAMMLPIFIGSVDQSILATSLPTIGRDLGNVHNLPWLITGFLIAATAFTPLYGKFADIHGRRLTLLIALGIYMAGGLISAFSTSMTMLILGRIVQGCGGGGLNTSATWCSATSRRRAIAPSITPIFPPPSPPRAAAGRRSAAGSATICTGR